MLRIDYLSIPPRWGRSALRIHPDGGRIGTLGCVGLYESSNRLIQFRNKLNNFLNQNNDQIRLKVTGSYNGFNGDWLP